MDSQTTANFKHQLNEKVQELYLDSLQDDIPAMTEDIMDIRQILDDIEATIDDN